MKIYKHCKLFANLYFQHSYKDFICESEVAACSFHEECAVCFQFDVSAVIVNHRSYLV
jgi:hypothetical protein